MKKNMFLIASIVTASVCGMETDKSNVWTITLGGTKINVHKGDILDTYADDTKKAEIVIVVGQYKQEEHGETRIVGIQVGTYGVFKRICFTPKQDSINYQKARSNHWNFPSRDGIYFLCITEPSFRCYNGKWKYPSSCWAPIFEGDLAMEANCKDLAMCYNIVLDKGIEVLIEKNIKNIALPMLGADFKCKGQCIPQDKAAPVAVKSIVEFIKKNRCAYNTIELFVEEDFEFVLYKLLLMRYCGLTEKICLLDCAHKDFGSCFSLLPREVIQYIGDHFFLKLFRMKSFV